MQPYYLKNFQIVKIHLSYHLFLISLLKMMQSQLLSLGGVMDAGGLQRLKEKEHQPGDYQALQARVVQLEGQVWGKCDNFMSAVFSECTCTA